MANTVQNIYDFINSIAPFETQEGWDNSGLLVGGGDREVSRAVFCLDVTDYTVERAIEFGAQLIVSHHPVIFNPLKKVGFDSPVAKALVSGISIISAHTNWDAAEGGVNDVLGQLLGLTELETVETLDGCSILRAGNLRTFVPAGEFAEVVAETLDTVVRVALPDKQIKRVAVCGGAGASFIGELADLGVDALITGDAKHNDFLDTASLDIALLAAGHYETETIAMPVLAEIVKKEYPELVTTYVESAPVTYIG